MLTHQITQREFIASLRGVARHFHRRVTLAQARHMYRHTGAGSHADMAIAAKFYSHANRHD